MDFIIRKDIYGNWWHDYNNDATKVNISDFEAVIDDVGNTFIIQCFNGSNVPSRAISIVDIKVIDQNISNTPIPFSGAVGLKNLLTTKLYPPYRDSSISYDEKVVFRKGHTVLWNETQEYFNTNFDSTGKGILLADGWALCNGNNGTKDFRDKFILNKGTNYNTLYTNGGSANSVLIGHNHDSIVFTDGRKGVNLAGSGASNNGWVIEGYNDTQKTNKTSVKGQSNTGVDSPTEDGVGKNMPPYIIAQWVERTEDLIVYYTGSEGGGGIESIVAGTNISVDNTDPLNPIISATGSAGVPTLQQVTDEGNTTTNDIIIRHSTDNEVVIESITDSSQISVNQGTAGVTLASQKIGGVTEALIQMASDKGYNLITEGAIQLSNSDNNTNIDLNDSGLALSSLGVNQRINLSNGVDDVSIKTDLIDGSYEQQLPNKSGTFAMLSDAIPYTGATANVNLGEFGLLTGNIEFDNTPTNIPTGQGSMVWNDTDGTVDLKLKGGNVTLQIGQEQVLRVVNKTATNINLLEANYQAVRVTGAQGQRLKVDLAQATSDTLSAETIGLVTETINNNQEGFITTSGLIRNVNTTGSLQSETWSDGDILYLSPTVAGQITKVKPIAPNHLVIIGYVIHAHATQGSIFVKVDNGYELDELHNVKIASATNNELLAYTSSTDIWENKSITSILGYTPVKTVVKDTVVSSTVTGTTTETILKSYTIAGGTFSANDVINLVSARFTKSGTNGNVSTFRMYINTTNSLSGAVQIAQLSATGFYYKFSRTFALRGGSLLGFSFIANGTQSGSDMGNSSVTQSTTTLNPANTFYIIFSGTNAVSTDSILASEILITN